MFYIFMSNIFRNEIEGKQYMEQLMTRQNASLASENSSSGLSEEVSLNENIFKCIFLSYLYSIMYNSELLI